MTPWLKLDQGKSLWRRMKIPAFLASACLMVAVGWLPAAASTSYHGKVRIIAREKVDLDKKRIFLGDVARIQGGSGIANGRLSGLYLCQAPALGETRMIDAGMVIRRLKQKGIARAKYVLDFKRPVRVTRRCRLLDPERVRTETANYLRKELGDIDEVKIVSIQVPKAVKLPRGNVSLVIKRPPGVTLRGKTALQAMVLVNGTMVRRIRVVADIRLFAEAVVVTRPLGRRQPVTRDLVALRKVEVTRCSKGFFRSLKQVLGMRSRSALPMDTILAPGMLEAVPVVKRGDVVKMIAESNGLRITTQGICREAGAPGQRIRVTNAKSRKDVFAEVVDATTVRVSF